MAVVRQPRGPHLSTCPWSSMRSSLELTEATSQFPSLPPGGWGEQSAGAFITLHDDLQLILGRSERQLAHTDVDDQQRHGGQCFHERFARVLGHGVDEFI